MAGVAPMGMGAAQKFITFVNASPSPFHVVKNAADMLRSAGFCQLREDLSWAKQMRDCNSKGKYFVVRNGSALVAFVVGKRFSDAGNARANFAIVAAHTDSPCLKLKPRSTRQSVGYAQIGVQPYGGGLWHTWFDRDLGVAGRVVVDNESRLVNLNAAVCRIPTLAIHLDSEVRDAFKFNKEVHLSPVLASSGAQDAKLPHDARLLQAIAAEAKTEPSKIQDVELCLYDVQPACLGGLDLEYIFSPRCDNLVMSFCGLEAMVEASSNAGFDADSVSILSLFDNEEVGSLSAYGAQSYLLPAIVKRIHKATRSAAGDEPVNDDFEAVLARSFVISADMAHAVHPNYSEKHEQQHRPKLNGGVVLKFNANQRYATTAATAAILRKTAAACGVPVQDFVVRGDSPCGTTIGPILASLTGIRCVDIGNPQLSMHSIREQAGVQDVDYAVSLFIEFYKNSATHVPSNPSDLEVL